MSHAVIIKNAVKKYGDFTALNGVSLDIKQGDGECETEIFRYGWAEDAD